MDQNVGLESVNSNAGSKGLHLECEICFRQYSATNESRQPHVGHCGHTFCQRCVSKVSGICGLCRAPFSPVKNYSLIKYLEKMDEFKIKLVEKSEELKNIGIVVEDFFSISEEEEEEEEEEVETEEEVQEYEVEDDDGLVFYIREPPNRNHDFYVHARRYLPMEMNSDYPPVPLHPPRQNAPAENEFERIAQMMYDGVQRQNIDPSALVGEFFVHEAQDIRRARSDDIEIIRQRLERNHRTVERLNRQEDQAQRQQSELRRHRNSRSNRHNHGAGRVQQQQNRHAQRRVNNYHQPRGGRR